ncbi:unnamed protein product, partial [Prorocentrum cordatum]
MATLEQLAQAFQEVRQQLNGERAARLAAEHTAGGAGAGPQRGTRIDGGQEQHIDPRVLNKWPIFNGRDEAWQEWSFIIESVCGMADPGDTLDAASRDLTDLKFSVFSPEQQQRAKQLYFLLVNTVRGKALTLVRGAEKHNGIIAWKRIKAKYAPDVGGRHTALLMGMLQPGWDHKATRQEFTNDLTEWETRITEYETERTETVSDAMKIAVLASHAPKSFRAMVRLVTGPATGRCKEVQQSTREYLQSGRTFNKNGRSVGVDNQMGPAPMDVDAAYNSWKGGGKDRGKGGSGNGKVEEKPATAVIEEVKADNDNEYGCTLCEHWDDYNDVEDQHEDTGEHDEGPEVHPWEIEAHECEDSHAHEHEGQVETINDDEVESPEVQSHDDQEDGDQSDDGDKWVFNVWREGLDQAGDEFLPLDSACEEHTCPWDFAEDGVDVGPGGVRLRGANGDKIPSGRNIIVEYAVLDINAIIDAKTPFVQSDVKRALLSVGKLARHGIDMYFKKDGPWMEIDTDRGRAKVPVHMKGRDAVGARERGNIKSSSGFELSGSSGATAKLELQIRDEKWLEERARPRCAWCAMGKGRAKPREQRPEETKKLPEFEMDFCNLVQDPKGRHNPGDQAWATTPALVDTAAQNPMVIAVPTKSAETNYISSTCTSFVKRVAYPKAILKVDPEQALGVIAEKVRQKCLTDGIKLEIKKTPRLSSQSVGRYHAKANHRTAHEDSYGKAYQGEVLKFGEAALFKLSVTATGKLRGGVRQGRVDARFERGIWLGKTIESDEHLFGTSEGVFTARTVKRVPVLEQNRADLIKAIKGTPWDRCTRSHKVVLQQRQPQVREQLQLGATVQLQLGATVQQESLGIRTPTEKKARVDELVTMDAEEHQADFDDDAYLQENRDEYQGADPDIVKAILKGKEKMNAMEEFDIFDVVDKIPDNADLLSTRWENVPRGPDEWRCRCVAREFKSDDPDLEGLFKAGATSSTGRLIDQHAVQHGYNTMVLDAQNAYFHADEDEEVYVDPPVEWVKRNHARGGKIGRPWWKMKKQLYGKRKASKKFNQYVTDQTKMLGIDQCPEQPSTFRRPGSTLVFEVHQDDIYSSGSDTELKWLKENLAPVLKLKEANLMKVGSVYSYLRATRTGVDKHTIHIAPRPKYIEYILSELGLTDCKDVPTPMVNARKREDLELPVVSPVDKSRCALKFGTTNPREFTKGQNCQALSSGESECYAAVTTVAEDLHMQKLMELIGFLLELKLRLDSTAARGIISRTGCGALKHIETRLLWLQAKYDEKKLKVHKEPTATNTADGYAKSLQATKFVEWRARLGMGFGNGDELETSKREALSGDSGQWAGRNKGPRALLVAAVMLSTTKAENHVAVMDSYEVASPTTVTPCTTSQMSWAMLLMIMMISLVVGCVMHHYAAKKLTGFRGASLEAVGEVRTKKPKLKGTRRTV